MFLQVFADQQTLTWIILPILIFLARVADVSLGTIRVIFITKGFKYIAPLIGFFEILIWLFAIGQIMQNLSNAISMIAYAGGFAAGTFVGMIIEEKLSFGDVLVRIISKHNVPEMVAKLKEEGFKITSVNAEGETGEVKVILIITPRKNVHEAIKIINDLNPNAFYTIEDVRSVEETTSAPKKSVFSLSNLKMFPAFKKGK